MAQAAKKSGPFYFTGCSQLRFRPHIIILLIYTLLDNMSIKKPQCSVFFIIFSVSTATRHYTVLRVAVMLSIPSPHLEWPESPDWRLGPDPCQQPSISNNPEGGSGAAV